MACVFGRPDGEGTAPRGGSPPSPRSRRRRPGACATASWVVGVVGVPHAVSPAAAQPVSPTFTLTWSTGPLGRPGAPDRRVVSRRGHARRTSAPPSSSATEAGRSTPTTSPTARPSRDGRSTTAASPSTPRRRCWRRPTGEDSVFVGAGNAADPGQGGYEAFAASGAQLWDTPVIDPRSDGQPAAGVQASMTAAALDGTASVVAGSLDQEQYALNASTGSHPPGLAPVHLRQRVLDRRGRGPLRHGSRRDRRGRRPDRRVRRRPQLSPEGGHLRILNQDGGVICDYQTTQTVDSSPAVGPFLPGGPRASPSVPARSSPGRRTPTP